MDHATKRADIIITDLLANQLPQTERLRWLRDRIATELRDAAGQPQPAGKYTKTVLVFRMVEGFRRVDREKTQHFVDVGKAAAHANALRRNGVDAKLVDYREPKSRIDYIAENEEWCR